MAENKPKRLYNPPLLIRADIETGPDGRDLVLEREDPGVLCINYKLRRTQ